MSQGQQRSPHEDFIMAGIIAGLTFGIGWAIWNAFHDQLTNMLRWIRVGEMWIVTILKGDNYTVILPDTIPEHVGQQYLQQWRHFFSTTDVHKIGVAELKASTYIVVPALRPLFCVILGAIAMWALLMGPNTKYRRRMTLEGLMKEQSLSFPAIAPFVKFNPCEMQFRVVGQAVPATLPLFAEALAPEEWVAYHEIQMQNNQIDANQTYQALALQLGGRWQGPLKLPIHAQGLYAAFALRHARKRKDSEELLGQLALHWTPENGLKLPLKIKMKIRKIITDPKLGGALQKHADKHAYATTALIRCLNRAREEGGVLAPASFLWLRGEDRELWYPLNNLGRRAYHAEAVGALVHYTNELIAGQKIPTPRFDDVIKGIEAIITGPAGRPIPALDRTPPAKIAKKSKFKIRK